MIFFFFSYTEAIQQWQQILNEEFKLYKILLMINVSFILIQKCHWKFQENYLLKYHYILVKIHFDQI